MWAGWWTFGLNLYLHLHASKLACASQFSAHRYTTYAFLKALHPASDMTRPSKFMVFSMHASAQQIAAWYLICGARVGCDQRVTLQKAGLTRGFKQTILKAWFLQNQGTACVPKQSRPIGITRLASPKLSTESCTGWQWLTPVFVMVLDICPHQRSTSHW